MNTVFIADDELIIRQGIKCIIDWEQLGFEIIGEASNGEDALNFILNKQPDLVLMYIRMPKMLGLDVVEAARNKGFNGKVIILSGYTDLSTHRPPLKTVSITILQNLLTRMSFTRQLIPSAHR